ncbi:MAG: DUF3592 domain-containing protein [Eubacterium sp.]|nr:DUF3592 domain-containing protein [Eubacterium sp.]
MKKGRPMKILALVFLILGIVFTSVAIVLASINAHIKSKYTTVEATIVGFEEHHGNHDHALTFVEYSIDGQEYENSINVYNSFWSVGDKITVYYSPENPNQLISEIPVILLIIFGAIGICFIIVGAIFSFVEKRSKKKKNYLLENGLAVTATVIHFEVNRNISVNGRHPYKLEVEYDDGSNIHRFRSDNVWENVTSDCIGEMVKVYYEPNNMNKYYVDTAGLFNEAYKTNDNVIYH